MKKAIQKTYNCFETNKIRKNELSRLTKVIKNQIEIGILPFIPKANAFIL
jgi:hypothetical protein